MSVVPLEARRGVFDFHGAGIEGDSELLDMGAGN